MKCKNCQKIIDGNTALHCTMCGADYCENCASEIGICECYNELKRYS